VKKSLRGDRSPHPGRPANPPCAAPAPPCAASDDPGSVSDHPGRGQIGPCATPNLPCGTPTRSCATPDDPCGLKTHPCAAPDGSCQGKAGSWTPPNGSCVAPDGIPTVLFGPCASKTARARQNPSVRMLSGPCGTIHRLLRTRKTCACWHMMFECNRFSPPPLAIFSFGAARENDFSERFMTRAVWPAPPAPRRSRRLFCFCPYRAPVPRRRAARRK